MYGQPFRSLFASQEAIDEWIETWARGLAGLSADDLKAGLGKCLTESPKWAPSLGEFRAMCKPAVRIAAHERFVPLPAPPVDDRARDAVLRMINDLTADKGDSTQSPPGTRYEWTLKLRDQLSTDYVWRDKSCVALHRYMRENNVVDENGRMTAEQIARAA